MPETILITLEKNLVRILKNEITNHPSHKSFSHLWLNDWCIVSFQIIFQNRTLWVFPKNMALLSSRYTNNNFSAITEPPTFESLQRGLRKQKIFRRGSVNFNPKIVTYCHKIYIKTNNLVSFHQNIWFWEFLRQLLFYAVLRIDLKIRVWCLT